MARKKPIKLTDREIESLCAFFMVFWATVVLEPRRQASIRGLMAKLGLVEKRGTLKLTRSGDRILQFRRFIVGLGKEGANNG